MPEVLFSVQYGSKLYGTATPTSDTDLKSIYLPDFCEIVALKKQTIFKHRWDAQGQPIPDGISMPENGVEEEFIPLQVFLKDFFVGQTYAVEIAFAVVAGLHYDPNNSEYKSWKMELCENLITEMVNRFKNKNVYSMVGFALKQTMDYVTRGDRLNKAKAMVNTINCMLDKLESVGHDRLNVRFDVDSMDVLGAPTPLDYLAENGFTVGETKNNNKVTRTLELNSRSYLETTAISHTLKAINKLIDAYGERTTAASTANVDFKSLSHAVRVYQQSIEYLETGKVTFPRQNADFLLKIKQGLADFEEVKNLLKSLDKDVQEKILKSNSPSSEDLQEEFSLWLNRNLPLFYAGIFSASAG